MMMMPSGAAPMGELHPDAFTVLFYALFAFLTVFPPTELIAAGLTLDKLAGSLLGSICPPFDIVGQLTRVQAMRRWTSSAIT